MAYPAYPLPAAARTFHAIGDTHIRAEEDFVGDYLVPRLQKVVDDTNRGLSIPPASYRLQLGDLTDYWPPGAARDPIGDQQQQVIDLFAAFEDGVEWSAIQGNHDLFYQPALGPDAGTYYSRTREELAALMGGHCPARLAVDKDYYSILGINGANANMLYEQAEFDALVAAIDARASTQVFIAHHRPLYGTVGFKTDGSTQLPITGPNAVIRSDEVGFYASNPDDDTAHDELDAMLGEYPQIAGWISGHNHTPFTEPRVVCTKIYGSNTIAAINTSATYYVGRTARGDEPVRTCWVTIEENPTRVEVRIRDHVTCAPMGGKVVLL